MEFRVTVNVKHALFACVVLFMFGCASKPKEKVFTLFGNVYRIDSVAGEEHFTDPFFVVLTKDSLFHAFGHWDYSYPYESELRVDDSLRVFSGSHPKYTIQPAKNGLWLRLQNGKRHLYSLASGRYDSAYKHLRIIQTQESLLLGAWKFAPEKSETDNILQCGFGEKGILRFTRSYEHKIAQIENFADNNADTCLHRDFRLDGSAVLIFDYDVFAPFTILKLDKRNLALKGRREILYFDRIDQPD